MNYINIWLHVNDVWLFHIFHCHQYFQITK